MTAGVPKLANLQWECKQDSLRGRNRATAAAALAPGTSCPRSSLQGRRGRLRQCHRPARTRCAADWRRVSSDALPQRRRAAAARRDRALAAAAQFSIARQLASGPVDRMRSFPMLRVEARYKSRRVAPADGGDNACPWLPSSARVTFSALADWAGWRREEGSGRLPASVPSRALKRCAA